MPRKPMPRSGGHGVGPLQSRSNCHAPPPTPRRARAAAAEEAPTRLLGGAKAETVASAWAQVQEAEAELRRAESHVRQAQAELGVARAARRAPGAPSALRGT